MQVSSEVAAHSSFIKNKFWKNLQNLQDSISPESLNQKIDSNIGSINR